jgi:uncharacterized cysteine cluster protein YcgN (CxxCxxCC family)
MKSEKKPFWEAKTLYEMTQTEWESLCDRCGQCCLHKILDESTGEILYTSIACRLLDHETCNCTNYENRLELVEDCLKILANDTDRLRLLPESCAYRRISEGKPLPSWHPLISKDSEAVHRADISIRGKVISEDYVHPDDFESYVVNR